MEDILKFTILNKLKSVYRLNSVESRKESSAEHTWSSLMLADFFFDKIDQKLDKLKVYELIMYHDIVEIETGDFPLHPEIKIENQKQKESLAAINLGKKLPEPLASKLSNVFKEFEECITLEAKFARAIEVLDPTIHEINYKEDWKGYTKEFLIEKKLKYFEEFPILKKQFLKILDYLEKNGYFNQ